jgi:hypothetical protein
MISISPNHITLTHNNPFCSNIKKLLSSKNTNGGERYPVLISSKKKGTSTHVGTLSFFGVLRVYMAKAVKEL